MSDRPDHRLVDPHPLTVAWWEAIWSSTVAADWVAADLDRIHALAELVDAFWREPSTELAAAIRIRRAVVGLDLRSRAARGRVG